MAEHATGANGWRDNLREGFIDWQKPEPGLVLHDYSKVLLPSPSSRDEHIYRNHLIVAKCGSQPLPAEDEDVYRKYLMAKVA
jgi:hypothetical protein